MSVLKLISSSNYIAFNKPLAKIIGVNAAIVFGELCSVSNMFNNDEFFYKKEKIEDDTCLGDIAVRTALKKLAEVGLISISKKGIPCRYFYKVNENCLLDLLNQPTCDVETNISSDIDTDSTSAIKTDSTGDIDTDSTFKKNLQKNLNKEFNNKGETQKNDKNSNHCNFKKPTLEEITKYCKERNNTVDPSAFINYYDSKGWMIGKNKMKDWQAAVRTWERNNFTNTRKTSPRRNGLECDYERMMAVSRELENKIYPVISEEEAGF